MRKYAAKSALYIWMQDNCPDIRIPQLHGFGLSHAQVRTISPSPIALQYFTYRLLVHT